MPTFIQESMQSFVFILNLFIERVIYLAERTQAVRKGRHLVLYSSASNE